MLPVALELKNFLPYRTTDPVRFDGIHLACLTGSNGAGKSSLLDAITWALWGKARARHDEDLVHQGQQDMYVQLDFEHEGLLYRVIRKRTRKQRSTGTLDLFVQDADRQLNLISEPTMRATQERINRLLRLDYETFVNSAFLQQGKADAFTTRTPKERKQVLADILGLAQWEVYEAQAREHVRKLDEQLLVYERIIDQINTELAQEPALLQSLQAAEQARADAESALQTAEAQLSEYEHVPHDLKNRRDQLQQEQQQIAQLDIELKAVTEEIERYQRRIAEYAQIVAQQAEIEAGYATLQAAREADQALADKLRLLSDFGKREHMLQSELRDARAALEQQATEYRTRINEHERALTEDVTAALAQVQAEIESLRMLEDEREHIQFQLTALGEERAERETTNRALREEMTALRERLDQLETLESALCAVCGQPLSAEHRQELIDQLTAEGRQRGDQYRANESRVKAINTETETWRVRLVEIDKALRRLQPLMTQAGALESQVNTATEARERLTQATAALAETEAQLEAGAYGVEIRQALQQLAEERVQIGYDEASHDAAREQLTTYREYEQRHMALQVALQSLPDAQEALDTAMARHQRLHEAYAERETACQTLDTEIAQLAELLKEYQVRQTTVNTLRTTANTAYQALVNAQQELRALDAQRQRRHNFETKTETARYEQALYQELRLAFSKNGIPAMIIEAAIPELETAANDLLRRMSDGRMALMLSTQREKKTGGVAETLDIQIADELGTRDYELYSGGEAFRIDFALRVALSQLLARRAGAQLRTLFIDEGFGTQDAEGRDRLVEAITAIQDDFDMILVITHIDELRDHFPVHIVVEKMDGGSRISVR